MNEQLARILALLSGAFLLRCVLLFIAVVMLGRTISESTRALKDVERSDAATEMRLAKLEARLPDRDSQPRHREARAR